MSTHEIETDAAPNTDTPYSQAIRSDERVYVSGYGPVDPETGADVDGDIATQTDRVLDNIAAVVEAAGGDGLDDVVKITVYLTDMGHYDAMNAAYGDRFDTPAPARVCVEVSRLPGDVPVEMDAIAELE